MSANWKAGDKAVCIHTFVGITNFGNVSASDRPQAGTIYLVTSARYWPECTDGIPVTLTLAGMHTTTAGYNAAKFRKIVTATEREEAGMKRLMEDLA